MKLTDLTTIEQLREFLAGTQVVAFSVLSDQDEGDRWIQREWVKFRTLTLSRQGKQCEIYPYENLMTLYDKLKSLACASDYLKLGLNFERLDPLAYPISDNQAADPLQKAHQKLFKTIHGSTLKTGRLMILPPLFRLIYGLENTSWSHSCLRKLEHAVVDCRSLSDAHGVGIRSCLSPSARNAKQRGRPTRREPGPLAAVIPCFG